MAADWEIRGLFGSEYALEDAVEELKKLPKVPEFKVLDRRNLQVIMRKNDTKTRDVVKRIITIAHGFVESDAGKGVYDKERENEKAERIKKYDEKRKRLEKGSTEKAASKH